MDDPEKTIAVVRGASTAEIETIFRTLVDQWRPHVHLAGLVAESHGLPDRFCQAGFLRNVATGARFSIFHDLGPGAAACHLDGTGAIAAAAAAQRDIAAGCDLVILSKFGKLEVAGDGLTGAFRAAINARTPLLTSVSPTHDRAWRRFLGREFVVLPAALSHNRRVAAGGSERLQYSLTAQEVPRVLRRCFGGPDSEHAPMG